MWRYSIGNYRQTVSLLVARPTRGSQIKQQVHSREGTSKAVCAIKQL